MLLRQLCQQPLRLLQIRRVKPLGEPAIYGCQKVVGFLALVLGLPQAGQAGGGAQFPGFGLLVTGDVDGLLEASFDFSVLVWWVRQEELLFKVLEFCFPPAFISAVHQIGR